MSGTKLELGTVRMRKKRNTGSTTAFSEDNICLNFVAFVLLKYILRENLSD
jgi:hypothetical protein